MAKVLNAVKHLVKHFFETNKKKIVGRGREAIGSIVGLGNSIGEGAYLLKGLDQELRLPQEI